MLAKVSQIHEPEIELVGRQSFVTSAVSRDLAGEDGAMDEMKIQDSPTVVRGCRNSYRSIIEAVLCEVTESGARRKAVSLLWFLDTRLRISVVMAVRHKGSGPRIPRSWRAWFQCGCVPRQATLKPRSTCSSSAVGMTRDAFDSCTFSVLIRYLTVQYVRCTARQSRERKQPLHPPCAALQMPHHPPKEGPRTFDRSIGCLRLCSHRTLPSTCSTHAVWIWAGTANALPQSHPSALPVRDLLFKFQSFTWSPSAWEWRILVH